ncbi:hypothetical protein FC68_GL000928 [Companilactobacillus farciminis KCTC 3681 = DSM 20184]|nr:hypothetical protein FC68_GL000928 [Companilactobacillus farciminis KCTC 3681 = DSM 20184]
MSNVINAKNNVPNENEISEATKGDPTETFNRELILVCIGKPIPIIKPINIVNIFSPSHL